MIIKKGLERPLLIGSTGAGFNHAWQQQSLLLPVLKQDKIIIPKEYALLGARALILVEHSYIRHQKGCVVFDFQMLNKSEILYDILQRA